MVNCKVSNEGRRRPHCHPHCVYCELNIFLQVDEINVNYEFYHFGS